MRASRLLALLVAVSALVAVISGLRVVRPGERIVVRRFGRLIEPAWEPGLHLGLPLGLDRLDRVRTDEVRRLSVGTSEEPAAGLDPSAGEFLTGDLNLVRIAGGDPVSGGKARRVPGSLRGSRGLARPAGRGQPDPCAGAPGDRPGASHRSPARR